jgi:hypothetical protein
MTTSPISKRSRNRRKPAVAAARILMVPSELLIQ